MSIFHWHVVDSQSFPLQVPGFEEVSEKGAYSSNYVYSPNDVQEIVSYAGTVSPGTLGQKIVSSSHFIYNLSVVSMS